jgi:hypothetical protein
MMTAEEKREKARLRSERWRRAHGIGPRRPAQRPWLAAGCSRSTWYRRKAKVRKMAAYSAIMDRIVWQAELLDIHLSQAALASAAMSREFLS